MNSYNEIMNFLASVKQDLNIKREIDIAYTQGKVDGWNEAIDYITNKMKEKPKTENENKDKK